MQWPGAFDSDTCVAGFRYYCKLTATNLSQTQRAMLLSPDGFNAELDKAKTSIDVRAMRAVREAALIFYPAAADESKLSFAGFK